MHLGWGEGVTAAGMSAAGHHACCSAHLCKAGDRASGLSIVAAEHLSAQFIPTTKEMSSHVIQLLSRSGLSGRQQLQ